MRPTSEERINKMIALRKQGLTYKEIGEEMGISKQRVCHYLNKGDCRYNKPIKEHQCVFVGIRNWMNSNNISMSELVRRLKNTNHPVEFYLVRKYLTREYSMRMDTIDRLLEITGLTYEQAFKEI